MREPTVAGRIPYSLAVRMLQDRLDEQFGGSVERLSTSRLGGTYSMRGFAAGWRLKVLCPDGVERRVDLLIRPSFPAGYPRTALVDRPPYLEWPHIERDGVLCLLPNAAEVDPDDPAEVAVNLLAKSARLIGELLDGGIVDRDFREEFLTYWFYASDQDAPRVCSLVRPGGPSRSVRVWRDRDGALTVAEDGEQLERWLNNLHGSPRGPKAHHHEPAALIWLPEPMLPSAYPLIGADLAGVAAAAGAGAAAILETLATATVSDAVVLIGAEGRGGPGLVAVTTTVADRRPRSRAGPDHPLTKGFRHKPLPSGVAAMRMFSSAPLRRSVVERADAAWVHGRGADLRTDRLLGRTVVIFGCGSVGSSVAVRLVRAGIGIVHLVDPERLTWSNVGRHELGGDAVGSFKAEALALRLRRELPHLEIDDHVMTAHAFMIGNADVMEAADLIVCATGSWDAEAAIDRWHIGTGRRVPIVYGWLEDRALAAHAVTIGSTGGCLRCGFGRTGTPDFAAVHWPAGRPVSEEPACGNHYQPYGAIELAAGVDLISRSALDAVMGYEMPTRHDLWLAPAHDVVSTGAEWSQAVRDRAPAALLGGARTQLDWPDGCTACRAAARRAA